MSEPTPNQSSPTTLATTEAAVPEGPTTTTIRSSTEFPADPAPLSRERLEQHYRRMRRSHVSLSRSRGQLLRRSREFSLARQRFLDTLRTYEDRLAAIGREKAEAMTLAQELHRELEAFEGKERALDELLTELDEAKQEAGFWSIFNITSLIEKMRQLLRGTSQADG
jgi:chromosome segregation ATPase